MTERLLYAAIVTVAVLSGCSGGKDTSENSGPVPVRVMEVGRTDNGISRRYIGTAAPSKSAILSVRHSGTLVSLEVSRGDRVRKGDTIAVIESQSILSMVETASASLRQAEDGYGRARMMYEKGSLPDVKMVEVETQLAQARATAKAASKALEDCTVRAPFDCTVSDVFVESGEELSAMSPVVRIYDMSSMEIRFSVPENEIGDINVGGDVIVEVPALGKVSSDGTRSPEVFGAGITEKGISGSVISHSYECIAVPDGARSGLMPGMVCKIRMSGGWNDGFVVPASLVRMDARGKYVWGLSDDMTVKKIYVVTGGFVSRGVMVTDGLEGGEKIITEGMQKVSTGMKVTVCD